MARRRRYSAKRVTATRPSLPAWALAYVKNALIIHQNHQHEGNASELGEGKETDLQLIFALASMLAYLSRTDIAIRQLEKLSWDWIKMDCSGGKCYGLLAVSYAAQVLPLGGSER